jgi:predicted PurR-regulated permease PerM
MDVLPPPKSQLIEVRRTGQESTLRVAGGALLGWGKAVTLDALIVGLLWLVGLEILRVPWAPLWALLAALFQFVPAFGGMLSVVGPAITAALTAPDDTLFHVAMVLGLYAVVVVLEGLVIQPLVLKRTTLVPWWAALLGPIVGGLLFPPWGVLIAPPVLAVWFALLRRRRAG